MDRSSQRTESPSVSWVSVAIIRCLEPLAANHLYMVGYQMDDSESLHRKWLFRQTSIYKWLFGVPGCTLSFFFGGSVKLRVGPVKHDFLETYTLEN